MFIILTMALVTYLMMIVFTKYKLPISVFGLTLMLAYGSISKLIPINLVFQTFPFEIVSLIIVLALFTKKIENLGFFQFTADLLFKVAKKSRIRCIMYLIFIVYISSMFMNNLSVILLFTFVTIKIAIELKLPIVPVLVATIISSNIGGAALPWADTPAVILTLYTDFTLYNFLTTLFFPCLFFAILLVIYLLIYSKKACFLNKNISDFGQSLPQKLQTPNSNKKPPHLPHENLVKPPKDLPHKDHPIPPHHHINHHPIPPESNRSSSIVPKHSKEHNRLVKDSGKNKQTLQTILLFILLLFGIGISPFLNISISIIVMICGSTLLILDSKSPEDAINTLPVLDALVFITTLFFIGTILEISGILSMAVDYIFFFTGTNRYFIVLVIILLAFIISTFLSAGPAAATLLPICVQLTEIVDYRIIYTALALGILAGSSMLPWSATGGPVMLGEVNRFIKQENIDRDTEMEVRTIFNLKRYLLFSIPFSLVILGSSILYLFIYLSAIYT